MSTMSLPVVKNEYGSNDAVSGLVWAENNPGRSKAGVEFSGFIEIIINGTTYRQRISVWDRGHSSDGRKQLGVSADMPQRVDSIVEGRSPEELAELKRRIEAAMADQPAAAPVDADGEIAF